MAERNKLVLEFVVDDKGSVVIKKVSKELKNVESAAGKAKAQIDYLSNGLKTLAARFGSVAISLQTVITGFVAYRALGIATTFLESAMEIENVKLRLNAMADSQREANLLFSQTASLAQSNTFSFQELSQAAVALRGTVAGSANDVLFYQQMIGDLAAFGKLSIEDTTLQLIRALSAGISTADLFRERSISAQLGFLPAVQYSVQETFDQIIKSYTSAESKIRGLSTGLANTMGGVISKIGDAWFLLTAAIVENSGIFSFLKQVLNDIVTDLDGVLNRKEEFRDYISIVNTVGFGLKFIYEQLNLIIGLLTFVGLTGAIYFIYTSIVSITGFLASIGGASGLLSLITAALSGPVGITLAIAGGLTAILFNLGKVLNILTIIGDVAVSTFDSFMAGSYTLLNTFSGVSSHSDKINASMAKVNQRLREGSQEMSRMVRLYEMFGKPVTAEYTDRMKAIMSAKGLAAENPERPKGKPADIGLIEAENDLLDYRYSTLLKIRQIESMPISDLEKQTKKFMLAKEEFKLREQIIMEQRKNASTEEDFHASDKKLEELKIERRQYGIKFEATKKELELKDKIKFRNEEIQNIELKYLEKQKKSINELADIRNRFGVDSSQYIQLEKEASLQKLYLQRNEINNRIIIADLTEDENAYLDAKIDLQKNALAITETQLEYAEKETEAQNKRYQEARKQASQRLEEVRELYKETLKLQNLRQKELSGFSVSQERNGLASTTLDTGSFVDLVRQSEDLKRINLEHIEHQNRIVNAQAELRREYDAGIVSYAEYTKAKMDLDREHHENNNALMQASTAAQAGMLLTSLEFTKTTFDNFHQMLGGEMVAFAIFNKTLAASQALIAAYLAANNILASEAKLGFINASTLAGITLGMGVANAGLILGQALPAFHTGGYAKAPTNEFPAMLKTGEFVVNKSATERVGRENLSMLNQGQMPKAGGRKQKVTIISKDQIEQTFAESYVLESYVRRLSREESRGVNNGN